MTNDLRHTSPLLISRMVVGFAWWTTVAGAILVVGLGAWGLVSGADGGLMVVTDVDVWATPIPDDFEQIRGSIRVEPEVRIPEEATWIGSARVDDVRGKLTLRPRGWGAVLTAVLAGLAFAAGLAWLHQLRSILRDVDRGRVFTPENVRRLGVIGVITFVFGLAQPVVAFLMRYLIERDVELVGARPVLPEMSSWGAIVFWGMLLMILSEIWRFGVQLQRDRDLTV